LFSSQIDVDYRFPIAMKDVGEGNNEIRAKLTQEGSAQISQPYPGTPSVDKFPYGANVKGT
jgi:hypothetical protein